MEHPLQITFRGMEPSDDAKQAVEERMERLERAYSKIESCRVVLEAPPRHQHKGGDYHVRIRLVVPGDEIVVSHDPKPHSPQADLHLAIGDAFHEATRQLEDYVDQRRRHTKRHREPERGVVARLFEDRGYGFLETASGQEIYFHENSVVDGFGALEVGTTVTFTEDEGDEGPRATHVRIKDSRA